MYQPELRWTGMDWEEERFRTKGGCRFMVVPGQRRGKRGPGNEEEGYHNASDTGDSARLVEKTMEIKTTGVKMKVKMRMKMEVKSG